MFSRKFQEGQAMLLVKRINETKHREPFAMSKVVVSLVRLRVLVLLFFFFVMTHCQVQMSRQTDSGDATWIHVSTIFLVLVLLHAPVAVAVAVALGYRAQNIAPSSRRLSPKRYRSENISNCRHFGYFIWRIWRMGAGRAYRVERARLRGTLRTLTIQL